MLIWIWKCCFTGELDSLALREEAFLTFFWFPLILIFLVVSVIQVYGGDFTRCFQRNHTVNSVIPSCHGFLGHNKGWEFLGVRCSIYTWILLNGSELVYNVPRNTKFSEWLDILIFIYCSGLVLRNRECFRNSWSSD